MKSHLHNLIDRMLRISYVRRALFSLGMISKLIFTLVLLGSASQTHAASASPDSGTIVSDGSTLSVPVLNNDTVSGPYTLTATLVQGQGTVGVTDPGAPNGSTAGTTVDFTPTIGFVGTVVINYTVDDGVLAPSPSTASVTITVTAPIVFQAFDDTATTLSANGVAAPVTIDVLANDSFDPQIPTTVSLASAVTPANAGTATVDQQNRIVFTPANNFIGTATFSYGISNTRDQSATANVTVNVRQQPSTALQANNDILNVPVNPGNAGAVAINILANDTYDPQLLTVTPPQALNPSSAGTIVYNAQTHQVMFTPAAHYVGQATFTYQIADGVNTATATATINIGIANLAANTLLSPEQLRAAQVLDTACASATGALENSCAVLEGLSAQDQQKALEQILPNQVPAQMQTVFIQQDRQLAALRERLHVVHDGGRGFDVSGLHLQLQENNAALGQAMQSSLTDTGSAGDDKPFADSDWGVFLTGKIHHGRIDNRDSQKGFDFHDDILTGGIDYRLNNKTVLGGAIGYSESDNDINNSGGNLKLKGIMLAVYGNYYPSENFFVDWIAAYTHNDYDGDRRIQFGTIDDRATFSNNGRQFSADISAGYDWHFKAWGIGPYVRGSYIHSLIDAYTESDDAGLALHVEEQQARSLETALGTRVTYALPHSHGVLIPGLDIEYTHQWQTDNRLIDVELAESRDSGQFGISTNALDKNYYVVGTSLTNIFTAGKSAFIRYQTVINRNNVRDNALEAGFRMEF